MRPGLIALSFALLLSAGDMKAHEGCSELQNQVLERIAQLHSDTLDGKPGVICREGTGFFYDKYTHPVIVGVSTEGVIFPCQIKKEGLLCEMPEGKDAIPEKSIENFENFYKEVTQ